MMIVGNKKYLEKVVIIPVQTSVALNSQVEVCFVHLNDITLVGSATLCSILKLSCDLSHHYTSPAD